MSSQNIKFIEDILGQDKHPNKIVDELRNHLIKIDLSKLSRVDATSSATKIGSYKVYIDRRMLEKYQNYLVVKSEMLKEKDDKGRRLPMSVIDLKAQNTSEYFTWQEARQLSKSLTELKNLLESHSWALKSERENAFEH